MSYRKGKNSLEVWQEYCDRNHSVLKEIPLPQAVLETEAKFRQYLTYENVDGCSDELPKLSQMEDEAFWKLHKFITEFFDMDSMLFEAYERSRINR